MQAIDNLKIILNEHMKIFEINTSKCKLKSSIPFETAKAKQKFGIILYENRRNLTNDEFLELYYSFENYVDNFQFGYVDNKASTMFGLTSFPNYSDIKI